MRMSISTQNKVTAIKPRLFSNVKFEFFSHAEGNNTFIGTVLLRNDEFVIDIQDKNAFCPYLINGKSNNNYFEGINSFVKPSNDVEAKWATVGKCYVGTWLEDGCDYIFTFKIPD